MARIRTLLTCAGILSAIVALIATGCAPKQTDGASGASSGAKTAGATGASQTPSSDEEAKISIQGSTTVLPLSEAWQKPFNEEHPDIALEIAGGGSGNGITALIGGTADIANASREIKDSERDEAAGNGIEVVEHLIAYDGLAVIVHPSNPIESVTVEQLSDIYTGKIKSWADLGGTGDITAAGRDSSSGTYETFLEEAVQKHKTDDSLQFAPEVLSLSSTENLKNTVASSPGAIGYIGLGYVDETVKAVPIIDVGGGEPVAPTEATVLDGTYPFARKLYCYTNGEPTGGVKTYMDWVLSEKGQAIVTEQGFVPIPK